MDFIENLNRLIEESRENTKKLRKQELAAKVETELGLISWLTGRKSKDEKKKEEEKKVSKEEEKSTLNPTWDEKDHPRGPGGIFIDKGSVQEKVAAGQPINEKEYGLLVKKWENDKKDYEAMAKKNRDESVRKSKNELKDVEDEIHALEKKWGKGFFDRNIIDTDTLRHPIKRVKDISRVGEAGRDTWRKVALDTKRNELKDDIKKGLKYPFYPIPQPKRPETTVQKPDERPWRERGGK